jgi:hypothetical protein
MQFHCNLTGLVVGTSLVNATTMSASAANTNSFTLSAVTVSIINTIANSTVLGAASNAELTSTWAIKTYVNTIISSTQASINGMRVPIEEMLRNMYDGL